MTAETSKSSRLSERRTLSERLLLFLSREPESADYEVGRDHWTSEEALSQLCRFFPGFLTRIADKEILDFGCGTGYQSVALARMGAKHVVGLDVNKNYIEKARQSANQAGLAGKVDFFDRLDESFRDRFDMVISQNSMEHFPDPSNALSKMKKAIKENGIILVTFGCPWFSPYGSHMHFFVKVPWINLLFDEKTVMSVRRYFRDDGATRYEDVEGGLNRMSVARFEKLVRDTGLRVGYKHYEGIKGINVLCKIPYVRELFVNNISCVLEKDSR
jgi:SAM-dependent methyltransferase